MRSLRCVQNRLELKDGAVLKLTLSPVCVRVRVRAWASLYNPKNALVCQHVPFEACLSLLALLARLALRCYHTL